MTCDEREADISELREHGTAAWECVKDVKPILSKILENKQIDCTEEELNTIYNGLKDVSCDATLAQFEKELNIQVSRIGQARNRMILIERWRTLSGTETVKAWSNTQGIPLLWVIPKDSAKAILTLISVQNNERTLDQDVINAINVLDSMDHSILTDDKKAEEMFMKAIGDEYHDIYLEKKNEILTDLKLKLGNDVSAWTASDIVNVQKTLKRYKTEKAKKEKLQNTQNSVKIMNDAVLRDKVTSFLNAHPEFCDEFN